MLRKASGMRASRAVQQVYRLFSQSAHAAAIQPTAFSVKISGGLELHGLMWKKAGDSPSKGVIAGLHGWMDSAITHKYSAQVFAEAGYEFLGFDLPGHGLSTHRPPTDPYTPGSNAIAVMEAMDALEVPSFALCSHSMGAGISSMVTSAWPDRVSALFLLDGIGMNSKDEDVAASALRAAYSGRQALLARKGAGKVYPSLHAAALARIATTGKYPGRQGIEYEAALSLVERGTWAVREGGHPHPHSHPHSHHHSAHAGSEAAASAATSAAAAAQGEITGYRFRHDNRLMEPSSTYLSETQMRGFLSAIRCPTVLVTGTEGWPWAHGLMLNRIVSVRSIEHHHLLGGHHLHLDPSTAPAVQHVLGDFLQRQEARMQEHKAAAEAAARQRKEQEEEQKRSGKSAAASKGPASFIAAGVNPTSEGIPSAGDAGMGRKQHAHGHSQQQHKRRSSGSGSSEGMSGEGSEEAAAASIASSGVTEAEEASARAAAAAAAARGSSAEGSLLTPGAFSGLHRPAALAKAIHPRTVFIATSLPYAELATEQTERQQQDGSKQPAHPLPALPPGSFHSFDNVVVLLHATDKQEHLAAATKEAWTVFQHADLKQEAAVSGSPLATAAAVAGLPVPHHSADFAFISCPDSSIGFPGKTLARNASSGSTSGTAAKGGMSVPPIRVGALVPKLFIESMPCLEMALAEEARVRESKGEAPRDAAALEAKGNAY